MPSRARTLMPAVGLAAALLTGCKPTPPPQAAPIVVRYTLAEEADAGQASLRQAYIAAIRGDEELDLSFKVSGIVERIGPPEGSGDWQEGAEVPAGKLLAQLKQADFTNAIDSAAAHAELARKAFERGKTLFDQGAISQQEFDALLADKTATEAILAERKQDLLNSRIVAGFSGTILARLAKSGEIVSAGHTVLRFASLARMSVEVGVPDRVVGTLKVGQPVPLEVPALRDRQFVGRISEVGVAARDGARLFKVVIKVDNLERALKSGMTANVRLEDSPAAPRKIVLVPLSALVTKTGGQLAVFVLGPDGLAHERAVETDDIIRSSIIITKGLSAGEKIVVVGAANLYDGAPVTAQPNEPLKR